MTTSLSVVLSMRAFCLATALIPVASSQALDQFKNDVVEVEVSRGANLPKENGSGFVVSVAGSAISIMTARHLFYQGKDRFAEDVSVTFAADRLHPRKAMFLTDSPVLDLAVLEVAGVPSSVSQQLPDLPVRPETAHFSIGDTLYLFGGRSQAWQVAQVSVSDPEDGDRTSGVRYAGADLVPGFSGAALFDGDRRLAGVHLGTVESDSGLGHGQLMGEAYIVLKRLGVTMNRLKIEPPPGMDLRVNTPVSPVGSTPLVRAIDGHLLEEAKSLLGKGADPNLGSPLTSAVEIGDADLVNQLFDKGAKLSKARYPRGIDGVSSVNGGGLLYYAVVHNYVSVAKALIEHGADVESWLPVNGNLLTIAGWRSSAEMVDLLLDHKAKVDQWGSHAAGTALHAAVTRGDLRMTKRLTEAGSSLQAVSSPGISETPLGLAYLYSGNKGTERQAIFDFLLNYKGTTPQDRMHVLALALKGSNRALVDRVFAMKVAAGSNLGDQPLNDAIRFGDPDMVDRLLKLGVDVNTPDRRGTPPGTTPMHVLLQTDSLSTAVKCRIFKLLEGAGSSTEFSDVDASRKLYTTCLSK